jgi:hypothetical protein
MRSEQLRLSSFLTNWQTLNVYHDHQTQYSEWSSCSPLLRAGWFSKLSHPTVKHNRLKMIKPLKCPVRKVTSRARCKQATTTNCIIFWLRGTNSSCLINTTAKMEERTRGRGHLRCQMDLHIPPLHRLLQENISRWPPVVFFSCHNCAPQVQGQFQNQPTNGS